MTNGLPTFVLQFMNNEILPSSDHTNQITNELEPSVKYESINLYLTENDLQN